MYVEWNALEVIKLLLGSEWSKNRISFAIMLIILISPIHYFLSKTEVTIFTIIPNSGRQCSTDGILRCQKTISSQLAKKIKNYAQN